MLDLAKPWLIPTKVVSDRAGSGQCVSPIARMIQFD